MPKYDFRCETCGSEFSESHPMGTTMLPMCPTCKNNVKVRKMLRAPMVHFKGSGFYKTDSSKSSAPKKPVTEPKPEKPVETKPAETKPAESKPVEKKPEQPK
jgi:putative FmdB family regulatory protein